MSAIDAEQVAHRTLAMEVADRIRDSILRGRLRPGAMINQVELAGKLGVSRGPLREALRQIEEEGLVANLPYRGCLVVPMTHQDVRELYSLRAALEEFAVGLFLQRAQPEHVEELEALLIQLRAPADGQPFPHLTRTDLRFHTRIVELSGHGRVLRIWQKELGHIRRALALLHHVDPDLRMMEGNHRPIMAAIRSGDVAEAQQQIRLHCRVAGEKLLSRWPEEFTTSEA
jgi:DNA-binding GntR family transcriptional regulator